MVTEIVKKQVQLTKIAGICGILIPVVFLGSIAVAMSLSPWFRWTNNAISDLGVEGIAAIIFNNGVIIAGILTLIFSIGLTKILSNKIGGYFLSMSGISLIFVGIFPEALFIPHYISSVAFFGFLSVSLLVLSFTIKKNPFEKNMGALAFIFVILAGIALYLLTVFNGIAIPEAFACFPALFWCAMYGLKMTFTTV